MRVRTGCTRGVSLLHRCSHPGSLTLLLRPSTTADCVRRRQPGSICDSVLGDDRGSPCGNACMRRAESDQGTGGELPQGHRRNHPRIGGVSFATAFALRLFLPRMTRSRPSTSTTISTAAFSSKKRINRHNNGRY